MQITKSPHYVVDTNVWYVAQIGVDIGTECHIMALQFLDCLNNGETLLAVDDKHLIFGEYFRLLSQQSYPYDLLTRLIAQGRVSHKEIAVVDGVAVIPHELERIVHDRSDRKFVAVSLSHSPPAPVVNATDSDWVDWEEALSDNGIEVIQLCPELVNSPRESAELRA